jgi:2-oxoisovalerate dehydrogenase E1 component
VSSAVLRQRFSAFITERFPFALTAALAAYDTHADKCGAWLAKSVAASGGNRTDRAAEVTPGVSAEKRLSQAAKEIEQACAGFFRREAIRAGLTADERREILRGMLLTRAVDNRLKTFFLSGEVKYGNAGFQGKGFRSLGQEAIYASAIRLKRGDAFRDGSVYSGDVVAPLIRDLGAGLAMRPDAAGVRQVLSAQMGKAGPPMEGRDLHVGDFSWGVLPAAAPLSISTLTVTGMALGFQLKKEQRVGLSFIGEGGSSLGEWHEAINLAGARKLPVVFCLENNQTALSTPVSEQSAARVFAEKAAGYGMPGVTIDGTDPDQVAATFAWAVERARAGEGPALIELIAMRMCGHAHHDDMLYLGKEPPVSWDYPPLTEQGYADPALFAFWRERDPLKTYAARLAAEGVITSGDVARWKSECEAMVEAEARAVIAAPWPDPASVTAGVFAGDAVNRARVEVLDRDLSAPARATSRPLTVEAAPPFDKKGTTFLDAVMQGVGDALAADPRTFVIGEDVGGKYGNAFLMLRPLLEKYGDRMLNSPLAEGAVLGACIGAALAGLRPIGEMQFNDFVATGFNQLVNNAAKIRYRWGGEVPMVVRMPWGGLRHAGPYHSQNTEPWFYRTPGLKIVVPSTPHDARAMMAAAVADPDPVLYYEHIGLYRDPRIKQMLSAEAPAPLEIGRAALRRDGNDLAIISYGAYVHASMRVAETLASEGREVAVLDLRSLVPLDREAVLSLARRIGKVLIVHEDSRTGGIGESLAAIIQEEAFDALDAPIRIVAALDTPVPYSPPLEDAFLPDEQVIAHAARRLIQY